MRFIKEKELRNLYSKGIRKTVTKFLWFPLTIDGETRWLETATIEYRVNWEHDLFNSKNYYWEAWNFINE